jgi:hypothetical protein
MIRITLLLCAVMGSAALAGCTAMSQPLTLSATDPLPPIQTVAIGENLEFEVNGKTFFPIMSWAQDPKNFKMLRGLGINTFCGNQSKVSAKAQCEAAQAAGGYAVAGFKTDGDGGIGSPRLLAWLHGDEPDNPRKQDDGTYAPKRTVDEVVAQFKRIKAADTSRPVFVTFTTQYMKQKVGKYDRATQKRLYPAYVEACDVAGFDEYPIYGSGHASRLNWPAYATTQLREIAGPERPIYAWIETAKGSKWMTYSKQPDVLPRHTRFEVWGVIINGATAIGYFTHVWRPEFKEFAPDAAMQAELARINSQITRLAPAILAPKAKAAIGMKMSDSMECHFKATERGGEVTLFAQNRDLGPGAASAKQFQPIKPRGGKATFTVAGLKAGTTIEVLDENRSITAADGSFVDEFGPLAEHIYRLKL